MDIKATDYRNVGGFCTMNARSKESSAMATDSSRRKKHKLKANNLFKIAKVQN